MPLLLVDRVWHRDVVSQRIEEAMRDGQFDNLRNKGKPLNLERNPFVPEDMEMAYNLLQNNDLPPSWITARTEVLKAIEGLRATLRKEVGRWGDGERGGKGENVEGAGALRARNAEVQSKIKNPKLVLNAVNISKIELGWREEMRTLNKRIEVVNLEQPLAHLEILKLVFEDEMQRAVNHDSRV